MAGTCHRRVLCMVILFGEVLCSLQFSTYELQSHKKEAIPECVKCKNFSLPTPDMIRAYGYPTETHTVTTEDGYILAMHRIPYSHKSPAAKNKSVIFLQHGLLGSSADWVMGAPHKSLGYILADAGYDVWLGNVRGNAYSRKHSTYSPKDKQFWEFSWDEMGHYDLPAEIDYVLSVTGQKKLYYIGHSMGTTMFFVLSSTRPEYNDKIRLMVGLGPVATVGHIKSPIRLLTPIINEVHYLLDILEEYEVGRNTTASILLREFLCDESHLQKEICESVIFLLAGFDYQQMNLTLLPTILGHSPAGTSTQTIAHYAQEVNTGKFCHYNWGKTGNMKHYGQANPPEYSLSNVTAPIVLFWAQNDWLADPLDVQKLIPQLVNLAGKFQVYSDVFNHLDFLWGVDADKLVFVKLIKILPYF